MIWENGIETCVLSYVKWISMSRFDARDRMPGAGALG